MNHSTNVAAEPDETDEDILQEVSDETLEAAAGKRIGDQAMVTVGPTILIGSCCLTWGADPHPRRGAADRGEYRQAAGPVAVLAGSLHSITLSARASQRRSRCFASRS